MLTEDSLTLHLFLKGFQSLIDIVVANDYLHGTHAPFKKTKTPGKAECPPVGFTVNMTVACI